MLRPPPPGVGHGADQGRHVDLRADGAAVGGGSRRVRRSRRRVGLRQCAWPRDRCSPTRANSAAGRRLRCRRRRIPRSISARRAAKTGSIFYTYEGFLTPSTLSLADVNALKAESCQEGAGAVRRFEACGRAVRGDVEGRDEDPVLRRASEGANWPLDGSTPTMMFGYGGFQVSLSACLQAGARQAVAGARRGLCDRQYPRRRRVRSGLAPGGAEGQSPARVRRFRGGRGGSCGAQDHVGASTWRSMAARTAAC